MMGESIVNERANIGVHYVKQGIFIRTGFFQIFGITSLSLRPSACYFVNQFDSIPFIFLPYEITSFTLVFSMLYTLVDIDITGSDLVIVLVNGVVLQCQFNGFFPTVH